MMQRTRYMTPLLSGFAMLLLTGCSALETTSEIVTGVSSYFLGGEDNKEPPAELVEYKPELKIEVLWDESVNDGGGEEQFLSLILAVSGKKALVADVNGLLQARNMKTGDLIWETETDYSFSAGPGVGESSSAFLATSNAEIVAFNIGTGREIWKTVVSSEVLASPVVIDEMVIVRTTDGKMVALDSHDGSQRWVFEKSVPFLSFRGTGIPFVVDGNIIAGYANGKLQELRLSDGRSGWETSIDIPSGRSEVERLVDLDVDPVETNGVVFVSSYQGGTTAVVALDGGVLWRNDNVSSYTGIGFDWRYLYISSTDSHVSQLDQRSGASLWKQDELQYRILTAPVVYDDYVIVGDYDGYVHWLSVNDGRQLGRIKVADSAIEAQPVVIDNVVYVYSKEGSLTALKATSL
jgi:outer membrane protein assembly factor BamB